MELQMILTEEERQLLVALLEQEWKDLQPELRRTRTESVHDELHARAEVVKRILARLAIVDEAAHVG